MSFPLDAGPMTFAEKVVLVDFVVSRSQAVPVSYRSSSFGRGLVSLKHCKHW